VLKILVLLFFCCLILSSNKVGRSTSSGAFIKLNIFGKLMRELQTRFLFIAVNNRGYFVFEIPFCIDFIVDSQVVLSCGSSTISDLLLRLENMLS